MSPASIPAAKELLRELDRSRCRELPLRALDMASPDEVRALVRAAKEAGPA